MSYIGLLHETSMTTYTNVSATDDLTVGTSLRKLSTLTQIGTATFSGGITGITTSMVSEGINLYWTLVRFNTAFATKTTTDLLEGNNLYYSIARFNADLATKTTSDLLEGTNLYYSTPRFIIDFNSKLATAITTTGITNNTTAIINNSTLTQIGLMKLGSPGTNIGTLIFYNATNTNYL